MIGGFGGVGVSIMPRVPRGSSSLHPMTSQTSAIVAEPVAGGAVVAGSARVDSGETLAGAEHPTPRSAIAIAIAAASGPVLFTILTMTRP